MTKMTAFKMKYFGARSWSDKFDYDTGPTVEMENDSLDGLSQTLKNVWAKGWDWVEIETQDSIMKFSKPYFNKEYSAIFGQIKEKK